MKTRSSMLSSLALAALATVTLNSSEALAKGGPSGMGGMRSFSAARTPIAVTKFKTFNTTRTIKKLTVKTHTTTAVVRNTRKLDTTKVLGGGVLNPPGGTTTPGGTIQPPGGVVFNPPGGVVLNPPGGVVFNPPGGPIHQPPGGVVLNPPGGVVLNPPGGPIHQPPGGVVLNPPGGVIVDPGPGGKLPPLEPPPIKNPPIVVNPPVVVTPVSVGVAAPVAVDPPGCTYERSVRKLPGGGLQRVLIKVCPDA
jgi:hypothetical protein